MEKLITREWSTRNTKVVVSKTTRVCKYRFFRIICLQLSRYLPIHGKTKEKEKIKYNQATYVYHDSQCGNQYKESKCEKDRTFLKLLQHFQSQLQTSHISFHSFNLLKV